MRDFAWRADPIERKGRGGDVGRGLQLVGHTTRPPLLAFEGNLADPRLVKNEGTVVRGSLTYRLLGRSEPDQQ